MPSPLPYMQLYTRDWMASSTVTMMSVTAEGIYFRLCIVQWEDGNLPVEPTRLQRLCRASDAEWAMFEEFLDEVFPIDPNSGHRRNKRVEADRHEAAEQIRKKSQGGKQTADKRWKKGEQSESSSSPSTQENDSDSLAIGELQDSNSLATAIPDTYSNSYTPQPPYGGPPRGSALDVIPGGLAESPPEEQPKPSPEPKQPKRNGNMPANWVGHAPPSLTEVAEYLRGRFWLDPVGEAENYLDHHLNAGWRYGKGKEPVKDWKAQLRTIEHQRTESGRDPRKLPKGSEQSWTPMGIAQELFAK